MNYISLFSGIEAASVAWEPLGWEPVAFSEIDPFACAVLNERFPSVPNLGDITRIDWSDRVGSIDLVAGGSPCQSFSVAGNREGLAGESGLMFEYIRAVRAISPRWFVWENVPGALSSEGGAAFGQLLSEMDACGYGMAWRVLDAQFFDLAQRRERVFLVGCLGDGERAAEVLFEGENLRWDHGSSKEKRKELAAAALRGARKHCEEPYCIQGDIARGAHFGQNGVGYNQEGVSYTLNTIDVPAVVYDRCLNKWDTQSTRVFHCEGAYQTLYTNATGGHDGGAVLIEGNEPVICLADDTANAACDAELSGTLKCGGMPPSVTQGLSVRRLMPVECERLQGFPDEWTRIPYRGKSADECPDAPRYKALGNSMAVPVMRWIGERIAIVEKENTL